MNSTVTNRDSATNVCEVAPDIYRINTPVTGDEVPGGFSFNQYLLVDEDPLLFHTGPRNLFAVVSEAVSTIVDLERLRYIGFCHFEADECGSLNQWLAVCPRAQPVCGAVGAMTSIEDYADRAPLALQDGQLLETGKHSMRWIDAPHVPHGWDNGFLFDTTTKTLFCGDLLTQSGPGDIPVTDRDLLEASERMRAQLDYYSNHSLAARALVEIAALKPLVLACMHGSAYKGDGAHVLRRLATALSGRVER